MMFHAQEGPCHIPSGHRRQSDRASRSRRRLHPSHSCAARVVPSINHAVDPCPDERLTTACSRSSVTWRLLRLDPRGLRSPRVRICEGRSMPARLGEQAEHETAKPTLA